MIVKGYQVIYLFSQTLTKHCAEQFFQHTVLYLFISDLTTLINKAEDTPLPLSPSPPPQT